MEGYQPEDTGKKYKAPRGHSGEMEFEQLGDIDLTAEQYVLFRREKALNEGKHYCVVCDTIYRARENCNCVVETML